MINIKIRMGMAGRGTKMVSVDPQSTVGDLKRILKEEEGALGVNLVYRGKPLNNDAATLASVRCYNNCSILCSLRLHGGMTHAENEGGCRTFVDAEVTKYGGVVTTSHCQINANDGCQIASVKKARLPCGCIFCADCMKHCITSCTIGSEDRPVSSYRIRCGNTGHPNDIELELAFAVAAYQQSKEADDAQVHISEAWMCAFMKVCPNQQCQAFVHRDNNKVNRVKCARCKSADWCWYCEQAWAGSGTAICGNDFCDPVAAISDQLEFGGTKTISGKANTPIARLCPGCHALNLHEVACLHMTCKCCRHQYCQVCLQNWSGHNNAACNVAGTQTVTLAMIQ